LQFSQHNQTGHKLLLLGKTKHVFVRLREICGRVSIPGSGLHTGKAGLKRTTLSFLLIIVIGMSACSNRRSENTINPATADALGIYKKSERSMTNGNFPRAIAGFEYLLAVYPFSDYAKQAQLDLMYAHYRNEDPDSAIEAADQFLLENPTHPRVDYAHYVKGLVYFERKRGPMEKFLRVDLAKRPPENLQSSYRSFFTVVNQYPDSPYAADARQRMVYLRSRLAQFELYVAAYYMNRGAYVAAANRAKYVLEHYDQTASVAPALQVMVAAYRRLELPELADNSMRVLEENYPDQAFAYGERGTDIYGTILERWLLRRSSKKE
jgi:outer membrane protein assembly factor BamD